MLVSPETIDLAKPTGDMPGDLFARAVVVSATSHEHYAYQSPEFTGDFSLEDYESSNPSSVGPLVVAAAFRGAVSSIGDHLPSMASQRQQLEELQASEILGPVMETVEMSQFTGCIMRPGTYRDPKGYSKVSLKAAAELGIGRNRGIHRVVHFVHRAETTGVPPTEEELKKQVDHKCRNPACFSPSHTRPLSNSENNSLKDKAGKVEPMLTRGQLFMVKDLMSKLPWLKDTILSEESDMPTKVISTPLGPFALRSVHPDQAIVYGERLKCEVFDALKQPAKNTYRRPSRRKIATPIIGQLALT
jgi:hypothetical protein